MKGAQDCGELVLANTAQHHQVECFATLSFPKAAVQDGDRGRVAFSGPAGTEQAGELRIVGKDQNLSVLQVSWLPEFFGCERKARL